MKPQAVRKAGFVLLTIGGVAGLIAVVVNELSRSERDRHVVLRLVQEIERKLRIHDGSEWLIVERHFPPGVPHPEVEAVHDQIRAALERLAHLKGLRLVVEDVEVGDETATVDYRAESVPSPVEERPVPRAGQFEFRRGQDGWALVGHSFHER